MPVKPDAAPPVMMTRGNIEINENVAYASMPVREGNEDVAHAGLPVREWNANVARISLPGGDWSGSTHDDVPGSERIENVVYASAAAPKNPQ